MRCWVRVVGAVCCLSCGPSTALLEAEEAGWTEPDTGETIVDADVLASEGPDEATTSAGLTVAQVYGRDDVWNSSKRKELTYCVDRGLGDAADAVIDAMKHASQAWEASANVHFVHLAAHDANCTRANEHVVFNVRGVSGRPYLARSFFPSSPRASRELLIDSTSLPPPRPLTLPGVLRHELGHVLGLRHEHTRLRSNRCYEDSNWRAVTPYDVRSVMHYPQCAGIEGHDLNLTSLDQQGIRLLYP